MGLKIWKYGSKHALGPQIECSEDSLKHRFSFQGAEMQADVLSMQPNMMAIMDDEDLSTIVGSGNWGPC